MNARKTKPRQSSVDAFSLVEVVMAIGIVSFALMAIIGVFGGVLKTSAENSERRAMLESVDGLRSFLNETNFATAFGWAKDNREFVYISYNSDTNGAPTVGGPSVSTRWLDPAATSSSVLASYESARVGRWLKARLSVSPSNPKGTNLTDAASYPAPSLLVLVQMDAVPTPTNALPPKPRGQSTLSILR